MDGMKYGAGLTMEQRLARLEQMSVLQSLLSTSGDTIVHNGTSPARSAAMAVSLYNPDYSGAATVTNATERTLDWNTEQYDYGGLHAAGASSIVVPTGGAGVYQIRGHAAYTAAFAAGSAMYIAIYVNNASDVNQYIVYETKDAPPTYAARISAARDVYLSDGWILRMAVLQASGADRTLNVNLDGTWFSARRVVTV